MAKAFVDKMNGLHRVGEEELVDIKDYRDSDGSPMFEDYDIFNK